MLKSPGTQAGPASLELRPERLGISVFGTIHPTLFRLQAPIGSEPLPERVRVASLDPQVGLDAVSEDVALADPVVPMVRQASFSDRFSSFEKPASFEDRFGSPAPAAAPDRTASIALPAPQQFEKTVRITSAAPIAPAAVRPAALAPETVRPAAVTPEAVEPAPKRHIRPGQTRRETIPSTDDDSRTAIYDISAHTVYMPNGRRLEAHSGLGSLMDDPRHVHVRMHGATPPNVYKLSMREQLFHGVRAIRLNPVDGTKMYGRAGILAHTYMLGPNGQSNGCVSFNDYDAFLNAYLRGEVTRMVVVDRLDGAPSEPKVASNWLQDTLKSLFSGNYAAASAQ